MTNLRHGGGIAVVPFACLLWGVSAGCTGAVDDETELSAPTAASVVQPPAGRGLEPVSLPDLSSMAEPVQAQMHAAQASLLSKLENPGTRPEDLGAAYGELGMLFMAAAYLDAARTCFVNAQILAPRDVRWPYYLGRLYQAQGPLEESVAAFERVLELSPGDVAALVLLGDVRLAQGDAAAAEPHFARALALRPGLAAARFGLGRAALAQRDYSRAVEELESALELDPPASSIRYPLGMAYRGLGDAETAEMHLRLQGDIETPTPDPLKQTLDELLESPNAYNIRGGRALDVGNYPLAADYFGKGLELAPDDPSLRHRLGTALFQMGDASGATEQFEQVVRMSPGHSRAQFSLGVLRAASGRLEDAIDRFSAALESDPGYFQARAQLAAVLAGSGRPEESLVHYEQLIEMDPANPETNFGQALAFVRLQRYVEARDRLVEGRRLHPDQPMFSHALARVLAAAPDDRVRDGRQAMALVEELLAAGQSVELGETAAMALAELGEYAQAAAVQRDVMAAAERAGFGDVVARMARNLGRYERGEPSRTPFTDAELP